MKPVRVRKSGLLRASGLALAAMSMTVSTGIVAQPAAAQAAPSYRIDPAKLAGLEHFIDGVMAQQLDNREVAGATVAVVHQGKLLFARGYGYQDVDKKIPVDPARTLFRPGSTSKLFTWTALMQLVEQGKVKLDDDVNKYIDFKIPATKSKPILIRHLLAHNPGLSDKGGLTVEDPSGFEDLGPFLANNMPDRVREPGVEISYSNHATALAGYIVERVSGEDFYDYVENHIFKPLGMNSTTFREPLPANLAPNMAVGYTMEDGRFEAQPFELYHNIAPAGSGSSTATDMANFMLAHLNEGRLGSAQILKPETARLMHSNLFTNVQGFPGYAHGFYVVRSEGPRLIGHGGNTRDFHSMLLLAPEADFGIFVSETGGQGSYGGRTELINAVIGRLFPVAPSPRYTGPVTPPPVGAYAPNRRDYSRPISPRMYLRVIAEGDRGVVLDQGGDRTYWEQIGPKAYEKVTGTRAGGPYDKIIFYGDGNDMKMSFASLPMMLFRMDPNAPPAETKDDSED
ncbi:serine hydrolase domain-containing protein [Sphingosinicella rhizophila]|uniref:Serine hydrolase domain-containing protein n=1 Tax=Sphingosinicella rhizophila TaxID=3050082 RepID=A0ABU3QCK7_9SPHN|nr:serine hydrolase domain-containing protein [Sphingosinicella sp. GR2756]MDT9600685.1 serine hydrolase domain-containing protein [Sphingosinicella sp. GR2756]